MKQFGGKVLFLDKSKISTEEILPAKYSEETDKHVLKQYLFEDLKISGFDAKTDIAGKKIIISREDFGCGELTEKVPDVFESNGIYALVAISFSNQFRELMQNSKLLTIELDRKSIDDIFHTFADKDVDGSIILNDDGTSKVKLISGSLSKSYYFHIGDEKSLLEDDKWIGYTSKK